MVYLYTMVVVIVLYGSGGYKNLSSVPVSVTSYTVPGFMSWDDCSKAADKAKEKFGAETRTVMTDCVRLPK